MLVAAVPGLARNGRRQVADKQGSPYPSFQPNGVPLVQQPANFAAQHSFDPPSREQFRPEPLRGANGETQRPIAIRHRYSHITWFGQVAQFCWIHAHNMLLQQESIIPHVVIESLNQDLQQPQCIGKDHLRGSYGQAGPFSSTAFNRYLYKHSTPSVYYKCILTDSRNQVGLTKEQFLNLLPPGAKGALIGYTPQGYTAGHMKCIRYFETDSSWYALDSMVGEYISPLYTDDEWLAHTRNSSIYALLHATTFP